ncbi:uncharacterized protein LOC134819898 isoform X2 [Bolinopsis microptera]|uniref:uncharacterized protein LOC134819898 isoform X2 n=1 Tax=Bolinopsis microptera TaxID=2820187 RepID=UPI00307B0FF2
MTTDKKQSKNWANTQWQKKEPLFVAAPKPNIIFPKIKDLKISKELALSKPIQLPDAQFRTPNAIDAEQYAHLSSMLRTNIFPGCEVNRCTSSYAQTYSNPYTEPNYFPIKSSKDFRRRKQGFSKRLEHDLEIKRIQAAWKEYFETQKQLINWDDKKSDSKPKRAAKA